MVPLTNHDLPRLIDHQIWIHHHVKHDCSIAPENALFRSLARLDMANQPGAVGTTGTHATA